MQWRNQETNSPGAQKIFGIQIFNNIWLKEKYQSIQRFKIYPRLKKFLYIIFREYQGLEKKILMGFFSGRGSCPLRPWFRPWLRDSYGFINLHVSLVSVTNESGCVLLTGSDRTESNLGIFLKVQDHIHPGFRRLNPAVQGKKLRQIWSLQGSQSGWSASIRIEVSQSR